jgi:BMFP domain-containing protein YqiC
LRHSVITMLDPKFLEDLGARLSALIAASPAADIEKNARALLSSGLQPSSIWSVVRSSISRRRFSSAPGKN